MTDNGPDPLRDRDRWPCLRPCAPSGHRRVHDRAHRGTAPPASSVRSATRHTSTGCSPTSPRSTSRCMALRRLDQTTGATSPTDLRPIQHTNPKGTSHDHPRPSTRRRIARRSPPTAASAASAAPPHCSPPAPSATASSMFATSLADYTDPDATPAESVDFLVGHQGQLLAWYIGIFIVFGAALVPLGTRAAAATRRPRADPRQHRDGLRRDLGCAHVRDRHDLQHRDRSRRRPRRHRPRPSRHRLVHASTPSPTDSAAATNSSAASGSASSPSPASLTARLPRWLNVIGVVTAVAGLVTVVPDVRSRRDGLRPRLDRLVRRRRHRSAPHLEPRR